MRVMVFRLFEDHNLEKAVRGEEVGTLVGNDVESVLA
jgi:uridylate kinase